MDKHGFFLRYGIDEGQFSKLDVTWDELCRIHDEYSAQLPAYEDEAKALAERLHSERSIHSIKYRVKDPEHLIEKIIRKLARDSGSRVSLGNYRSEIRDLVGVRALHLLKEDWLVIHNFLAGNWEFHSPPKANYKAGDPAEILDLYSGMGCELYEHPHGYRSVHYGLRIGSVFGELVAEVQVRTLFEEAWSEIDHHFRYQWKNGLGGDSADQYLGVINNLAYNADALASYLNKMKPSQGEAAPGGKSDGEPGGKPGGESGGKPGGEPGGKSDGEPGGESSGKPGDEPVGESSGKPDGEPGGVARVRDLYKTAMGRGRP